MTAGRRGSCCAERAARVHCAVTRGASHVTGADLGLAERAVFLKSENFDLWSLNG